MNMQPRWFVILALSLSLCVAGCADSHDDHGDETHTAVEEACEHVVDGPFEEVAATAEADGAPSATFEHTAVQIALVEDPANDGSYIGNATYASDAASEFAFFISSDVPFAILDSSDSEVTFEETADVTECAEIAKEYVADLEVATYTLRFGPTTETMVSLVVEEASHEAHEGEH